MEVEKRTSKGGFLNLFDWGVKSRKKLFIDSSESPGGSNEGKENVVRPSLIGVNENAAISCNKGSNDYNSASSVTSDEGSGTRAPGVVARLMGLDSMPTSNVCESCSATSMDSCRYEDTRYDRNYTNFRIEPHNVIYNIMHNKVEGISWNPANSTPQKMKSRPIERFQAETLPRKSAKTIPITHHKLLSPIKSPGFILTKNAAYMMEAASKMIPPSPETTARSKTTTFGSSSVPIKIRDLKERMEATQRASGPQRPRQNDVVKHRKGQHINSNICNRSENTSLSKASVDAEKSSDSMKNKGKSISLTVQAKVNAQRKEGSTSRSKKGSLSQKQPNEVKSNQFSKSQPNIPKSEQKSTSTNRTAVVLRQNNQKQNSIPNKDKFASQTSVCNQQSRKSSSANNSCVSNKTVNKVVLNSKSGSRKMGLVATGSEKEVTSSKIKNFPRKKQSVKEDIHFEERISHNVSINKDGRSIQCNAVVDGCLKWGAAADKRKDGMDVVSFTFASPIKGSISGSQSSDQSMKYNGSYGVDSHGQNDSPDSKYKKLTSLGLNVIGTDALSILLEHKLRELTYKMELPQCNLVETEQAASSASSLQEPVSSFDILSTASVENGMGSQVGMSKDKSDGDSECSSVNDMVLKASQVWKEEHSSLSEEGETRKELDCLRPSQVSTLEPSISNGGCYSSDGSRNTNSNDGSKQYLLAEPHEEVHSIHEKEFQPAEDESELSDSESSMFTVDMGREHTPMTSLIDFMRSTNWEQQYVRDILDSAELMVEDFVLGQSHQVITPNLFDQLETVGSWEEINREENSKLERKVLFDCLSECLVFRCGKLSVGEPWARQTLFQRKGWLAEELYKEISGLRSMEDLMIDELVDKDMSTEIGRWLDFKIEAFEEGVEIEKEILLSLVDELVADIVVKQF